MRLHLSVFAALAIGLSVAAQEPGVFRVVGNTVPVYATVTDKSNRIVTNLTREQFSVRDNGKVQPLTVFDNTPQPVRLVVLVDVSGSMYGNLPLVRAAGRALFANLGPDDVATVGTFGRDVSINPTFSRDERTLVSALPTTIDTNAGTPLWRAVNEAMDVFGDGPGRRVVLVASDGKDNGVGRWGTKPMGHFEIVDRANREDVMLYAVAMQSRLPPGSQQGGDIRQRMIAAFPDPGFGLAAEATGGGYLEIAGRMDLSAVFARVVEELHSQYLLGFAPPATDGKSHEVDVRVTAKDTKVRARKSYVAPRAGR